MKSKFEAMEMLRVFWYRDVHSFEYWRNLHKNIL